MGGALTTQMVLSNEGTGGCSLHWSSLPFIRMEWRWGREGGEERERKRGERGEGREGKRREGEGQGEFLQATGVLIFL